MSVQLAEARSPGTVPDLPTRPETDAFDCPAESPVFRGRPGGLTVGSNGTLLLSVPSGRVVWRMERGWAHSVSQIDIHAARDRAERSLVAPTGLSSGPDGTIYVADAAGHRIWAAPPDGTWFLVAGSVYGYGDGPSGEARFRRPTDVAIGPDGTLYVADSGNHCIRTISPDGVVDTLAGSIFDFGDGRGADGRFRQPSALDVDAEGNCYVADTGNNAIRRVAPDGAVSTVAGSPPGGDADGVGMDVGMRWPTGIVIGHSGELWVADYGNRSVRRIERSGAATTVLRFDGRRWPVSLALAAGGELIVATEMIDRETRPLSCLISIEATR